jgi:endoglucanase
MAIRATLIAALLASLTVGAVAAEPIVLKRGLGMNIWETWPDDTEWVKPGVLDVFPEWRRTVTEPMLRDLPAAGFDFVRLTIDPAPFLTPDTSRAPHLIEQTLGTVRLLGQVGLKVIVDLHTIPSYDRRMFGTEKMLADPAMFDAYLAMVGRIGMAIADQDPAAVAFEPINEPVIDCDVVDQPDKQRWPAMLARLHRAARDAAPKLTLILSGGCWGGAGTLAAIDPKALGDDNIIWSFHNYEPFAASHQGASWIDGPERYLSGVVFPPDKASSADRKRILRDALAEGRKAGAGAEMAERIRAAVARYFEPGAALAEMDKSFGQATSWADHYGTYRSGHARRHHGCRPYSRRSLGHRLVGLGAWRVVRHHAGRKKLAVGPRRASGFGAQVTGQRELIAFAQCAHAAISIS